MGLYVTRGGQVGFLAGLERGAAVLEVLGSLDHGSILLDIDQDCSQPPTLGHEKNLFARTKLIEVMTKPASQVVCGNYTGNCHVKATVEPTVRAGFVLDKRPERRIWAPVPTDHWDSEGRFDRVQLENRQIGTLGRRKADRGQNFLQLIT